MTENDTDTTDSAITTPEGTGGDADDEPTTITTDDGGEGEDTREDAETDERGAGKEAAKYRRQLRATETERDQLRDQLTAQRRAVIDWRSSNAVHGAVDPQLLDAAGIDVDTLIDPDTGHLDMAAVDAFIDQTATKFRVHRVAKPNPQQGQPSQRGSASWASVIKQGTAGG